MTNVAAENMESTPLRRAGVSAGGAAARRQRMHRGQPAGVIAKRVDRDGVARHLVETEDAAKNFRVGETPMQIHDVRLPVVKTLDVESADAAPGRRSPARPARNPRGQRVVCS